VARRVSAGANDGAVRHPQQPRETRNHATLDDLDRAIIRILQVNGRTPNTDIARALDVTETTVRNRVTRLLNEQLINIVAVPTPHAVGLTLSAIIGLSVELGRLNAIATSLESYSEVRYVGLSTGRYDIMVEAFFQDHEHLLEFATSKVGNLEGVRDVETSLILRVNKFSYEWEIP
jgi:Lrp/AsnC family transcriptional regulator, regulator for asnA, asnC and gidA